MKIRFYLHTKHLQVRRWKIFYIVTMAFVVFTIISAKLLVGEKASEEQLRMAFSMIQYESAILSVLFFCNGLFCILPFKGTGKQLCISKAFAYRMESVFFCVVRPALSANVVYYAAGRQ